MEIYLAGILTHKWNKYYVNLERPDANLKPCTLLLLWTGTNDVIIQDVTLDSTVTIMSDVDGDRSSLVFVEFRTSYVCQHEDLCVALSGSLDELGNWDVRNALLAEETPEYSGKWKVAVELPAGTLFEWKWVVIWRENLTAFRWEERSNRIYDTGYSDGYIHVKALWNMDGEYHIIPENNAITWEESDEKQLEELSNAIDTDQSENGSIITQIIYWIGNRLWNMFNNILLIFK